MLVRFHLSTGAILDKDVPNMNDIGHVSNTLAKFGRIFIDDYKGAVLKEHVVYLEEAPLSPEEVHGPFYADNGVYDPRAEQEVVEPFDPQDREPMYGCNREQWHPGRG